MGIRRTPFFKLSKSDWGVMILLLALALCACSDDKKRSPPDDDGDMHLAMKASCSVDEELKSCSERVLASSPLSAAERETLSTCEIASAREQTSAADVFAAAKAAVKASCH